jgi:hypothetical protein
MNGALVVKWLGNWTAPILVALGLALAVFGYSEYQRFMRPDAADVLYREGPATKRVMLTYKPEFTYGSVPMEPSDYFQTVQLRRNRGLVVLSVGAGMFGLGAALLLQDKRHRNLRTP